MTHSFPMYGPVLSEDGSNDFPPLEAPVRQMLIDGLNDDLAREYQAIVMYTHYSAKLKGPFRRELRALFQAEIPDEQGHAQFLAEKIVSFGGEPTTVPLAVHSAQYPREMLEHALIAEKRAISAYMERITQAEACAEIGLKVSLENIVADETRHMDEIARILDGWSVK